MFSSCTSLTESPELPATNLAEWCYQSMFVDCISLVEAPELPATELAPSCYQEMFYNCSSLISASCSATDISVGDAVTEMFGFIETSGNFNCPEEMEDTWWNSGVMPSGWTINGKSDPRSEA